MTHQKWKKVGVICFVFPQKGRWFSCKSTDLGFRTKFNSPFDGLGSVIDRFFFWRFGWTPRLKKELSFFLELESTEPSMLL